jgi:hypothetical protein
MCVGASEPRQTLRWRDKMGFKPELVDAELLDANSPQSHPSGARIPGVINENCQGEMLA